MPSVLLMNIGNTRTQLALADCGGKIDQIYTVPTGEILAAGTLFFEQESLRRFSGNHPCFDIAVSTVVPEIKTLLAAQNIFFVSTADSSAGIDFSPVDCSTLGQDRIANAIMLGQIAPTLPGAVIDFGTAITFELVDGRRFFRGGAILPGRKLLRQTLKDGTKQLPELDFIQSCPEHFGINTRDALRAGIDLGVVGAIRELMALARREFGDETIFYAAGGDRDYFLPLFPELKDGGDDFTLRGIYHAYIARHHAN